MSEIDNTLQLPTWEETPTLKETGKPLLDLSGNYLDYTLTYPEPRYLLEYREVPFAPLGGIQAITGHKKNGKTFLMCQFMAAILAGDSERMRAQLPALKIHQSTADALGKETSVLYIDTEMEALNTVKVVRRVQYLCGWDYTIDNPRLRVLWLRAEEKNAVRWEKTKQAIYENRPTAIFLDGLRDVVGDFNDNKESADIISECMTIATQLNCCLFTVLHENPGSDKMRGHLGTELGNKVTDTFVSVKTKNDNQVYFTVKQVDARGKDVPDYKFEITDDAGSLGVPRIIDPAQVQPVEKTGELIDEEWKNIVREMKAIISPPKAVSFTTLRTDLRKVLKKRTDTVADYIKRAKAENILIEQNGKLLFNIQNGDAVMQGLPF